MQNLAIFDLDHTLLSGDSNVIWTDYLYEHGLIDAEFIQRRAQIAAAYKQGKANFDNDLSQLLLPLANYPRQLLTQHRDACFVKQVKPKFYVDGLELLKQHQQRGDTVIIISATNEFLIAKVGEALNVDTVIGVMLQTDQNGEFTGKYVGTPSFGAGKLVRLKQWLDEQQRELSDYQHSYFYSDSINDAPLLKQVSHAVVVNPDIKLAELAQQNNWRQLNFTRTLGQNKL